MKRGQIQEDHLTVLYNQKLRRHELEQIQIDEQRESNYISENNINEQYDETYAQADREEQDMKRYNSNMEDDEEYHWLSIPYYYKYNKDMKPKVQATTTTETPDTEEILSDQSLSSTASFPAAPPKIPRKPRTVPVRKRTSKITAGQLAGALSTSNTESMPSMSSQMSANLDQVRDLASGTLEQAEASLLSRKRQLESEQGGSLKKKSKVDNEETQLHPCPYAFSIYSFEPADVSVCVEMNGVLHYLSYATMPLKQ